jgi:general secretion pathway protein H
MEMLVVVAVLGFALALVVTRGPMRSRGLEMQGAVSEVVQALRLARSRAIASNGPSRVIVDVAARSFRIDAGRPTVLPADVAVSVTAVTSEGLGGVLAAIRFNGDGSASGGRIGLADGQRTAIIGVDWLTGRVSVARTD